MVSTQHHKEQSIDRKLVLSITWAVGLPDFSSQVVRRKSFLGLFNAHASLFFGKARWYLGGDCPVFHWHLTQATTRKGLTNYKLSYQAISSLNQHDYSIWCEHMFNLQQTPVPSSSSHLPVGVFAFWTRHPGIHLDSTLERLHPPRLQNRHVVSVKMSVCN